MTAALLLVSFIVAQPPRGASNTGSYDVYLLDVGTGLSVFVTGDDFNLPYDAGRNDDLGTGDRNHVVAYLKAIKPDMKVIDHVIVSHSHQDHTGLMPDVLDTYQVTNLYDSGAINPICSFEQILSRVATKRIAYHPGMAFATPYQLRYTINDKRYPVW